MRNTILKSTLTVLLAFVAISAFSQKKETRNVSDFNGVGLSISADLYLSQGSTHKVVIEGDQDELEIIETVVKNGMLHIKTSSRNPRLEDVKVWVTSPEINSVHLSGSGKIMGETAIKTDEISFKVSGSGKIKIDKLEAGEVDVSVSGSGHIALGGTAEELGVSISGSGSLNGADFRVDEASARISGSGSCKIDATGELDASISGSGRVTYYSNPQVDASVSGSGKVRKGEK
jgi:hypothetical protein